MQGPQYVSTGYIDSWDGNICTEIAWMQQFFLSPFLCFQCVANVILIRHYSFRCDNGVNHVSVKFCQVTLNNCSYFIIVNAQGDCNLEHSGGSLHSEMSYLILDF